MKNLITNLWNQLYGANLERFAAPYRSAGDIELYTMFEVWLMGLVVIVCVAAAVEHWLGGIDRKRRLIKKLKRRARRDIADTERRLALELSLKLGESVTDEENFVNTPWAIELDAGESCEKVSALAPKDLFQEFYRVAPELAPFPQN